VAAESQKEHTEATVDSGVFSPVWASECSIKSGSAARCQRLSPVILATQEAEIRRISVQSQPRQIVRETLSPKPLHKNWAGGVAED
jgi:hypothetical protein